MTKPRLKPILFERGLTARELARRSGISETIISLIANGRYVPDPVQKSKIASVVGVPAEVIFSSIRQMAAVQAGD